MCSGLSPTAAPTAANMNTLHVPVGGNKSGPFLFESSLSLPFQKETIAALLEDHLVKSPRSSGAE